MFFFFIYFHNYLVYFLRKKCNLKKIFSQLSHGLDNLYLKSYTFCLYFILFFFRCVGPDPNSDYGSGSTKLLNTDSIRFRIQNSFCHI